MVLTGTSSSALVLATLASSFRARQAAAMRLHKDQCGTFTASILMFPWPAPSSPVLILAVAVRTYSAAQLLAGAEREAQRLGVEDYTAYAAVGVRRPWCRRWPSSGSVARATRTPTCSNAHAFQATSARDIFASPTAHDADTSGGVMLDRLPTFVGDNGGSLVRWAMR